MSPSRVASVGFTRRLEGGMAVGVECGLCLTGRLAPGAEDQAFFELSSHSWLPVACTVCRRSGLSGVADSDFLSMVWFRMPCPYFVRFSIPSRTFVLAFGVAVEVKDGVWNSDMAIDRDKSPPGHLMTLQPLQVFDIAVPSSVYDSLPFKRYPVFPRVRPQTQCAPRSGVTSL